MSDLPPPPLLAALRAGTRDAHDRTEAAFVLADPARVTVGVYVDVLSRLAAYHAAAEAALAPWADALATHGADPAARAKTPLLRRDLAALAGSGDVPDFLAPPPAVPTPAHAFGLAYVLEGATLGGQLLRRQLGPALGLTPEHGLAFFAAYGADTGPMWRAFTAALERFDAAAAPEARATVHADAVRAARAAFLAFERDVVRPTAAARQAPALAGR